MTRRRWVALGLVLVVPFSLVAWYAYHHVAGERMIGRLEDQLRAKPTVTEFTEFLKKNDLPFSVDRVKRDITAGVPIQGVPFEGMKTYKVQFDENDRVVSFTADYQWSAP
jgi:hypothetical protein